jgi:predicted hotdog family 3-hydroxylacyl-ACP dehydratase
MRFIDEIVGHVDGHFVCHGRIPAAFAVHGEASPLLGLELGAQAAAVLAALDLSSEGDAVPRLGYLVSIRPAAFRVASIPAGERLTVRVRPAGKVHPLAKYAISVAAGGDGEPCLEATIGTYALE